MIKLWLAGTEAAGLIKFKDAVTWGNTENDVFHKDETHLATFSCLQPQGIVCSEQQFL